MKYYSGHSEPTTVYRERKQASKITELPSSTLRYYESEGLLPDSKRDRNGHRYDDDDYLEFFKKYENIKFAYDGMEV